MNYSDFIFTFIPLFIAVDSLGNLPLLMVLTEEMPKSERRRVINIALITATALGLVFLLFGQAVLNVMGIKVGAFAIAGGLILFVLSLRYITTGHLLEVPLKQEMIAVVPIGTPLITGPATITTLLLLASQFPLYITVISFTINMIIAWLVFSLSLFFYRFFGRGGLKAVSNVFNLLLAAIAVNMIIKGLALLGIISV